MIKEIAAITKQSKEQRHRIETLTKDVANASSWQEIVLHFNELAEMTLAIIDESAQERIRGRISDVLLQESRKVEGVSKLQIDLMNRFMDENPSNSLKIAFRKSV